MLLVDNLHKKPFRAKKNNRKMNRARYKLEQAARVQSIPIYHEGSFIGYKYIFHK
jgi:hypothetical protein